MRMLLASLYTLIFALGSMAHAADEPACSGDDLIAEMRAESPKLASQIEELASAIPNGDGLLWRIENASGGEPSHLFGTMHLADPRLLELDAQTLAAFETSRVLALEVTDVIDPAVMQSKMAGLAKYTAYLDGSTISDRLQKSDEALVEKAFGDRSKLPWFVAKRLKPWAIMGAMALPACEIARKEAGKPFLDQDLGLRARKAGKELVSLETLESQMVAMDSLSENMMLKALVETAKLSDQLDDVFETMIRLYEKGDIAVIWAMMKHLGPEGLRDGSEATGYNDFQREIVDRRNVGMTEAMAPLVDKGGAFVAVGALHLPGEKGIVELLRAKGYIVTAVR